MPYFVPRCAPAWNIENCGTGMTLNLLEIRNDIVIEMIRNDIVIEMISNVFKHLAV